MKNDAPHRYNYCKSIRAGEKIEIISMGPETCKSYHAREDRLDRFHKKGRTYGNCSKKLPEKRMK